MNATQKYNIVGVNGQGKSVLFRWLIKQLIDSGVRVLLYDSERQYSARPTSPLLSVYTPRTPGSVAEFDHVAERVLERGRMVFAVESIDFYAPPKRDLPPNLKKIVHWGRETPKVGLITTSRRPADVHKDVCGLALGWFLLHLYLPNDIKYLRGFVGEAAESLTGLEPFRFVYWERGRSTTHNPVPEVEL